MLSTSEIVNTIKFDSDISSGGGFHISKKRDKSHDTRERYTKRL